MKTRMWRLNLIPPPPGATTVSLADQLKDYCAHPEGLKEIPDRQPAITERIRRTLTDAAQGKVDPESIAPESRERLISFLQRDGRTGAMDDLVFCLARDIGLTPSQFALRRNPKRSVLGPACGFLSFA